ncbi:MAG: hypothetical protein BYD32DRAFT_402051 [Podila humilis]|nr:MAG: hypothetical protein BYD32DRAFT_402051 [Podila humilis]
MAATTLPTFIIHSSYIWFLVCITLQSQRRLSEECIIGKHNLAICLEKSQAPSSPFKVGAANPGTQDYSTALPSSRCVVCAFRSCF